MSAWVPIHRLAFAFALALLAVLVLISALADYMFQSLTGGINPTMWIVATALRHANVRTPQHTHTSVQNLDKRRAT